MLAGVLIAVASLVGCANDGFAADVRASIAPGSCSFGAFVQEDDPAGLNLRDEPSMHGHVLGRLPPTTQSDEIPGLAVRIEVEVLGYDNGWFHVAHARDNPELTGRPERKVPSTSGWVGGRKLTVKSQATHGHSSPDASSPVVLSLGDAERFDGDGFVAASRLIGCSGSWALIDLEPARLPAEVRTRLKVSPPARESAPAGHVRAWVDQICGVQETTCEGASGTSTPR